MEIWVEFTEGRLAVSPETAKIPRGASVTWRFRTEGLPYRNLRWTIYFTQGYPFSRPFELGVFRGSELDISVDTMPRDGQHVGASPAGAADDLGHYKYGIRLEDPKEDQEL